MTHYTTATTNYPQLSATPINRVTAMRDPVSGLNGDRYNFILGDEWLNKVAHNWWKLADKTATSALWIRMNGIISLTGDTGGPVFPDGNQNINTLGTPNQITVTGNPSTHTLTWSLTNGTAVAKFQVDAFTPPGTDPVVPDATGKVTITGGQVATGVVGTNVIRTDSLAANTFTIEIQRSTAVAASDVTKNGVSHFNSSQFTVDANGFVSATAGSFTWQDKSTDFAAVSENGYNIIGSCTATLPAAPANGASIKFYVTGAFVVTLQANTGQTIQFATNVSSVAGTQANTHSGDGCQLVYMSSSTSWKAIYFTGAWNKT